MISKTQSILIIFLMISSAALPLGMITHGTSTSTLINGSNAVQAETDFNRVTWEENLFPNKGLEEWSNPTTPNNIYTYRSTEKAAWYETTNYIEGVQSLGMHARALDPLHYSETSLCQTSQIYWSNPLNATLDFDWYLDEIGNPTDQDYFLLQIRISNRIMYYYLGCETTAYSNGTNGRYFIDGPTKNWNHLHLNLTSDFIDQFSLLPTEFQTMYWYVRSYSTTYTRVFLDDVNLINGTTVNIGGSILNGDFEIYGYWSIPSSSDPADISQSPEKQEGDWSMNMTVISYDYNSYAYAGYEPNKLLSDSNQGELSFKWKIDDWVNPTTSNYARMIITAYNATMDFQLYYYFAVGGSGTTPPIIGGNPIKIKADSFNVTDTWNEFDRNIWEDFTAVYETENLWIEEIEIQLRTTEDDSRLSVLFDDISFLTSILNDMNYEHQNDVGTSIEGWSIYSGPDVLTVTNFSSSGTKAANLSISNYDSFYGEQRTGQLAVSSNTELILDFNIYIDSFNTSSEDFVFIQMMFDDVSFAYVIANSTSEFESYLGEENHHFILLSDTVVIGEWMNFQRDIIHDYEEVFGNLPDTYLTSLNLIADAVEGSILTVFFDDVYIYYDSAPEITDVEHMPSEPTAGSSVVISAMVIDATTSSVEVNLRVNNGTWSNVLMNHVSGTLYETTITGLLADSVVEYSITAIDAFGKTKVAMNGTDYFRFIVSSSSNITTTTSTQPENAGLLTAIFIVVSLVAIGVVFVLYNFVYKKR